MIVYLRRQDSFYESLYSTAIKSGNTFEFSVSEDGSVRHDFRYNAMLVKWEKSFKQENITVKIFEKNDLYNSDVVEDFIHTLKLPIKYQKENRKKENLSLGRKKLTYLKIFNQFIPEIIDNKINPLRGNIVDVLEKLDIKDSPIRLTNADRLKFLSRFEQGNRMIAKRYFSGRDELFDKTDSNHATDTKLTISTETAIEITSKIWERNYKVHMDLMNETLYLKCELLLEKKLIDEASQKIEEYLHRYPNHSRRYYLRAKLLYLKNDVDKALIASKKSLELNPSNQDFEELYEILKSEKL